MRKRKSILIHICAIFVLLIACLPAIYYKNFAPKIDLSNYNETINSSTLPEYKIEVINKIFEAVKNQETIVETSLSLDEVTDIVLYFELYYGVKFQDPLFTYGLESKNLYLNLDIFERSERAKIIIDARIEEALSSFYDGSDRFKLWQIANYLSNRITYKSGQTDLLQALNGSGNCQTYSKLFYKMATRLGIETYCCRNEDHTWNMVILNGKKYFYDITWYDTDSKDFKHYWFLHSDSAWGRDYICYNNGGI